jgi:hypothetical protein
LIKKSATLYSPKKKVLTRARRAELVAAAQQ